MAAFKLINPVPSEHPTFPGCPSSGASHCEHPPAPSAAAAALKYPMAGKSSCHPENGLGHGKQRVQVPAAPRGPAVLGCAAGEPSTGYLQVPAAPLPPAMPAMGSEGRGSSVQQAADTEGQQERCRDTGETRRVPRDGHPWLSHRCCQGRAAQAELPGPHSPPRPSAVRGDTDLPTTWPELQPPGQSGNKTLPKA